MIAKTAKTFFLSIIDFFFIGILVVLMIVGYIFYGVMLASIRIKRFLRTLAGLAVLFCLLTVIGVFVYRTFLPLPGEKQKAVFIVIQTGMNAKQVAGLLKEKKLIRNKKEFTVLALWFHLDRKLKAGRYMFKRSESLATILHKLSLGKAYMDFVTIREGITLSETAALLNKHCGVDSVVFMKLVNDAAFIKTLGIHQKSLEGYMFPETYRFAWGTKPPAVITTMLKRFLINYDRLKENSVIAAKYSRHQIVTLASIVEKETGADKERPLIAGVFWNRLRINMMLGADPTVRYALKKFTGPLTVSNLNVDSPYNTRRYRGLPPGPICSPGLKTLKAALYPDKTKKLYFVAKADGSGEHYFSRSFKEHLNAKNRAERKNKKHKFYR